MFTKNTMAVVVTVICVFLLVTGMPGAHAQVPTGDESLLTTTCSASTNPCAGQTYPLTVQTGVYACYSNGYFGTDAAAAVAVGAQACTQEQLEATEEYTINDWCNIPFTYPSAFPAANLHGWDAKCCECIANSLFATQPDYCVNISGAGENFVYGMFQAGCSTAAEQLLEESFLNVGQGTNVCNPVNYFMVVGSMWANDPNIGMPTVNGYPTPLYNWSMWPQCSQCTNSSGGSCCVQAPAAASTLLVAKNPLPKPSSNNGNTTTIAIAVSLSVAAVALIAVLVVVVVVRRRRRFEQQQQQQQLSEPLVENNNESL